MVDADENGCSGMRCDVWGIFKWQRCIQITESNRGMHESKMREQTLLLWKHTQSNLQLCLLICNHFLFSCLHLSSRQKLPFSLKTLASFPFWPHPFSSSAQASLPNHFFHFFFLITPKSLNSFKILFMSLKLNFFS